MKIVQKALIASLVLISTLACSSNTWALSESEVIHRGLTYLGNNLLELTDKEIETCIDEVRFFAHEDKLDEKIILKNIYDAVSNFCDYHKKNIGNPRDPIKLKPCIEAFALGVATHMLTYAAYRIWWKPCRDDMHEIYQKHPNITRRSEFRGRDTMVHIDGAGADTARLVELLNKNETCMQLIGTAACIGILPWAVGFKGLYEYFTVDPQHQECYEKLFKIKEYLETAMKTPRKNIRFIGPRF